MTVDGYFTDRSMLRIVQSERALAISGPRAVMMQAAHPLAVKGFLAHTTTLDKPYDRFARIATALRTIGFGSREDADTMAKHVRAAHARISGKLDAPVGRYPAGTPYRADQPELLMWVLFSLVDSALVVYDRYIRSMSRAQEAAYWEDYKLVGELLGLKRADMPDSLDDLDAYRREMLIGNTLLVTDWARDLIQRIILEPPVPRAARPLLGPAKAVTVSLLPERIRREYGFPQSGPVAFQQALITGSARGIKHGVLPLLPDRLRLIPAARNGLPVAA